MRFVGIDIRLLGFDLRLVVLHFRIQLRLVGLALGLS